MSGIKAFVSLSGKLSSSGSLSGKISASASYDGYSGAYEVVPNAHTAQILPTSQKLLSRDITVSKVPYFETSNTEGGITVYIGNGVD